MRFILSRGRGADSPRAGWVVRTTPGRQWLRGHRGQAIIPQTARVLWGSEHQRYGDVAVEGLSRRTAVALSRGRLPKPYAAVDPNEDVVAAVQHDATTLLVVADGHNGEVSSEAAVRSVLDHLAAEPPPTLSDGDLLRLFSAVDEAVVEAVGRDRERADSRTTLSLALVHGTTVRWAALGDSPVIVGDARGAREVTDGRHDFLGWPLPVHYLDRLLQRGSAELGPDGWVAVASDGFSNFRLARSTAAAAAQVVHRVSDARRAAKGLVDAANAAGAGDNVAVAVNLLPRGATS